MRQPSRSTLGVAEATAPPTSEGDSCSHAAPRSSGDRCRQPRSCYDCLNVQLAAEPQGCMIATFGNCRSMDEYNSNLDYRRHDPQWTDSGLIDGGAPADIYNMFPSLNTTYCERDDAACVQCRTIAASAAANDSFLASTTQFCLGQSDCVCIVACESPNWPLHFTADCPSPSNGGVSAPRSPVGASESSGSTEMTQIMWTIIGGMLFIFVFAVLVLASVQRRRIGVNSPRGQLRLSAWRSLQQELIARDKTQSVRAQSMLHSALPPSVEAAAARTETQILQTRTERVMWTTGRHADGTYPTLSPP